jgi:type II secretion system protein F
MPRFIYRAKNHALQVVEGTIEADDEATAIGRLGSQGVYPIAIVEAGAPSGRSLDLFPARISQRTLAYTTHQLADLLGGGLPLLSALSLLAKQTEHPALARVVESLAASVREGRSLSEALAEHPRIFPPLYISMVKAGEVGGGLEQSLTRLAELGESEADLRSRVMNAAAYPAFVLCVAFAMTIFLMTYVIPKLSLVFIESDQVLPLPTRLLMAVSTVMTQWWWALLAALLALGWAAKQWSASPAGRAVLDRIAIGMPWMGPLWRKLETARFARNLGVLVGQGVPVLQALDVVGRNISNLLLRRAVEQIQNAVRDGASIAVAVSASGQFPVFVSNMVAVGEESGTVDQALMKVATTYERDVDRTIRTLTTVLEPVLLLVVGGVVMFIVLAMLLPVFQIGLGVQ